MSSSKIDKGMSIMDVDSQNSNEMDTQNLVTVSTQASINFTDDAKSMSITSASQLDIAPRVFFRRSRPSQVENEVNMLKENLQQARKCAVRLRRELRQERQKNVTLQNYLTMIKKLYDK